MNLRKRGYLLRSTKYAGQKLFLHKPCKQDGHIQWTMGLFFVLFLGILLFSQLQLMQYGMTSLYLEDALAASNLASAVVDLEEYGISHKILISDPEQAYKRYCAAVKGNLNLNEEWECPNKQLIFGAVRIENYTIYNVAGEEVMIYSVAANGQISSIQGKLGNVRAPNGTMIEATSVYSEISFGVKGLFGIITEAHKGKLADVVSGAEK